MGHFFLARERGGPLSFKMKKEGLLLLFCREISAGCHTFRRTFRNQTPGNPLLQQKYSTPESTTCPEPSRCLERTTAEHEGFDGFLHSKTVTFAWNPDGYSVKESREEKEAITDAVKLDPHFHIEFEFKTNTPRSGSKEGIIFWATNELNEDTSWWLSSW